MINLISLGWGVQSWTLAAMVALGDLPPVDVALHSDTTWEMSSTYEFAKTWTPWLESRGVRVVTVGDATQPAAVTTLTTDIPAFTVGGSDKGGRLRRQCTSRWKIQPMRRWIGSELERRGLKKSPGAVSQWLGITTDEWHRAKDSDVRYISHKYPLIDLGMSRADCINWLKSHDLPVPQKSSCTFCPFHNRRAWAEMRLAGGPDWEQAVAVDNAIRGVRPPYPLFVHSDRIPLEDAVVIPEMFGVEQLTMIPDDECDSGYCFL